MTNYFVCFNVIYLNCAKMHPHIKLTQSIFDDIIAFDRGKYTSFHKTSVQ